MGLFLARVQPPRGRDLDAYFVTQSVFHQAVHLLLGNKHFDGEMQRQETDPHGHAGFRVFIFYLIRSYADVQYQVTLSVLPVSLPLLNLVS